MNHFTLAVNALLREPPLRRLVKIALKRLPVRLDVKALWDAAPRPHYLFGILEAACEARREGHESVAVIEFGVADGAGLLVMQAHAQAVELATGIEVHVYGFDSGEGLPALTNDHRDHPDIWQPGDYRMNVPALRQRLAPGTTLILGPVADTIRTAKLKGPIGFMAMDLDLYSSTAAALPILTRPDAARLRRVGLYFDDLDAAYSHRFAGELLAIEEFNAASSMVKIDRWRGIQAGRPFPDADWLRSMYLAHDLEAIGRTKLDRGPARMR